MAGPLGATTENTNRSFAETTKAATTKPTNLAVAAFGLTAAASATSYAFGSSTRFTVSVVAEPAMGNETPDAGFGCMATFPAAV